jgi:hypothetical protein
MPHVHLRSAGAYKAPNGASYLFNSEEVVQSEAELYCQERGGHLVSYASAGEQAILEGMTAQTDTERFFQDAGSGNAALMRCPDAGVVALGSLAGATSGALRVRRGCDWAASTCGMAFKGCLQASAPPDPLLLLSMAPVEVRATCGCRLYAAQGQQLLLAWPADRCRIYLAVSGVR